MPVLSRGRRLGVGALAALGLVVAVPTAAYAHPFGPPLTAQLSVEGRTVELELHMPSDDWMAIAQLLQVFDEAPGDTTTTGEQRLVQSEKFASYLTESVRVSQDGDDCARSVTPRPSLLEDGIVVVADCPEAVDTVTLDITTLHEVHANYRTVVSGAGAPQTLFTSSAPTHELTLTGGTGSTPLPGLLTAGGFLAAAAAAAVAFPLLRRRTREASRA
ncbi:hypothetical protein [Motilibacter aurantiacus]|uniref:hypothetical protein n=1 Tax=Motilibacter aurantiacus TaxID=2714955 RepID=UPI0014085B40|nr:hypothetical protein [Motilibacter aurantiacus]NHC44314.1 hypothetical protein [Motilibacter aurantiacus]